MKRNHMWIFLVVFFMLAVVITASLLVKKSGRVREGSETKNREITLRLNWIPDPTFTGAYIAKSRGFWKNRGIEVKIKQGGMNLDPLRLVTEGTDNFGITGADRLLQARTQGLPVVAVSLELRDNPVGWIVREDSGIKSFRDLVGKQVGQKYGSETEAIYDATVSVLKIDPKTIHVVPVQFSLEPFLNKQVDAFPVYVNEEPHTVEAKGVKVRIIHPSDYGIGMYGNVLFTLESTVKQDPMLVQSFVDGLLDGWNASLREQPDKIAKELIAIEPDMGNVPTEKVLVSTLELAQGKHVEGKVPIGWMDTDGWTATYRLLTEHAGLKKELNIGSVFDNGFVEHYYRGAKQ